MNDNNIEQDIFAVLNDHKVVALCDGCIGAPYAYHSIRQALYRLRAKGRVETVVAGGVRLFFVLRDAVLPADARGKR